MKFVRLLGLVCVLVWQQSLGGSPAAASGCRVGERTSLALPGQVDSLAASDTSANAVALIGKPGAFVRFLPHDSLVELHTENPSRLVRTTPLPTYLTAPGLAVPPTGSKQYVLVDSTLITMDGAGGRPIARQNIAMQAIGWPAAITADASGDIYLIGQPNGTMEAQAYAFKADRSGALHQRWRAPLGLTHAGTWIGLTAHGLLAVYMPDSHDVEGTMLLLEVGHGGLHGSYAVSMPPVAADAGHDRLYLAGAGAIHALALHSGAPVATVAGDTPPAIAGKLGLAAFVRARRLIVARDSDLHPILTIPLPGGLSVTALAWQGSSLLVGNARGVTRVSLDNCP
jgi:hypothetical protein